MPAAAAGGGDATDGVAGRVLADLLAQAHLMAPGALAGVLAERARPLGVRGVRIYLADLQQRHLHPLPDNAAQSPAALSIDSTLAGRAFQTVTIHRASTGAAGGGLVQLWMPLIDGTERLGVLELVVEDAGEAMLGWYRALGSLAGLLIASKSVYSDTYAQVGRSREMALQAEMVWAFIAPTTFATEQVILSAVLEPAYEVGGDAFDYSLLGEHLHVSLFDAAGHDLAAGLIASVAMASSRTTRRSGGALADIAARARRSPARPAAAPVTLVADPGRPDGGVAEEWPGDHHEQHGQHALASVLIQALPDEHGQRNEDRGHQRGRRHEVQLPVHAPHDQDADRRGEHGHRGQAEEHFGEHVPDHSQRSSARAKTSPPPNSSTASRTGSSNSADRPKPCASRISTITVIELTTS
jgi:hypothetical protein